MRGKVGAAHFEMIISFVFFVGFVFFLFMVLKPQDTTTLSGAVVAGLYDSFENKVYTNLSSVLLKADYDGDDCFYVVLPGHVFVYDIDGEKGSYVTKVSGEKVKSNLDNEDRFNINKTGDEFFRVAISPEFGDDNVVSCDELTVFEMGVPVERRVISYSKLEAMSKRYHDGGYEDLRDELRVPAIFDFAINAESLNINMEPPLGIPDSVEVIAEDRIVEVLYKNGTVVNERFTLKIW